MSITTKRKKNYFKPEPNHVQSSNGVLVWLTCHKLLLMLKTTKNWLLLEDEDEAPYVQGPWITIKKTASLVLNTLHHFQLCPHQDLVSHEGGEILLEEHGQMFFKHLCIVLLVDTVDA